MRLWGRRGGGFSSRMWRRRGSATKRLNTALVRNGSHSLMQTWTEIIILFVFYILSLCWTLLCPNIFVSKSLLKNRTTLLTWWSRSVMHTMQMSSSAAWSSGTPTAREVSVRTSLPAEMSLVATRCLYIERTRDMFYVTKSCSFYGLRKMALLLRIT